MSTPFRERNPESHKGDYGHLLVLGGSPGLTGAVCLCSLAALRSGCGLVTAGIPESLNPIIEIKLTEVMSIPLPETREHTFSLTALEPALEFLREHADGLVLGPGISVHPETARFIRRFVPAIGKPAVLDADALKALAGHTRILAEADGPIILTPHPGEMSVLSGKSIPEIQNSREKTAEELAKRLGVTVVLKGHRTVVTDGKQTVVNQTGNPGMATAGSGDVLAGMIGGFLVQGGTPFVCAETAVRLHGLAGDLAAMDKGQASLIASDLIEFLPRVLKPLT